MAEEEKRQSMGETGRGHVRETVFFKVKFKPLSTGEYEMKKAEWAQKLCIERKSLYLEDLDADIQKREHFPDSPLLLFLLEMDEKLDQILAHLSGRAIQEEFSEEGMGIDLSGGGMKIRVAKPLEQGQLLFASLFLSRFPLIHIRLFGEVVRTKANDHGENVCYDVGVRFLDLNPEEEEKIISCVFQRQREILRKLKSEDGRDEEGL